MSLSHKIKYLMNRNGTFYYSRRMPDDTRSNPAMFQALFGAKTHYRVSLKTKDQAVALVRFKAEDDRFHANLTLVRGGERMRGALEKSIARPQKQQLTPETVDRIQDEIIASSLNLWRRRQALAEINAAQREEYERLVGQREEDAEDLLAILIDGEISMDPRLPNIASRAHDIALENEIDIEVEGALPALIAAVRQGMLRAERKVDRLLSSGEGSLADIERMKHKVGPKLSEMFDTYILSQSRPRTISEIRGTAKALIASVGDKRTSDVSSSDIRAFCVEQAKQIIGHRDPKAVCRPISAATLHKKIALIRAAFNHATNRGVFTGANPASQIKASIFVQPIPAHLMPRKRPFRVPEMNEIFAYPWFSGCTSSSDSHSPGTYRLKGMQFWVPIIAAFSGLRAGEIGGLRLEEILLDDACPHILVRPNKYRPTKNGQSRRVPILDVLIDLRLADFVESMRRKGVDRLFDDWKSPRRSNASSGEAAWSNAKLLRSFNRIVLPKCLGQHDDEVTRREVTFHSFRGAFKTMLGLHRHGLSPNFINEVIGHAKSELDDRYVGEIPIEETYPAMRSCRYEGLILPTSPII